jgi:hypothetical protein
MNFYTILHVVNPRLVWPGFAALVICGVVSLLSRVIGQRFSMVYYGIEIFCGIAIFCIPIIEATVLAWYLAYPSYFDHMEANIAAVSWLGWMGHPLYPSLTSGDVYGVPYGPLTYQTIGFALWLLGPSVMSSKALGVAAFAAAQIVSFVVLRRSGARAGEALLITAAQCAVQSGFTIQGYAGGARSDALLFLAAQTAMLPAISRPRLGNALAIGLFAGIIANLKIHLGLCVLPAFVYFISRAEGSRHRLLLVAAAGSAALVALIVPFLPPNVSVINYFSYFHTMTHHHIGRWLFEQNVVFGAALIAPALAMLLLCGRRLPPNFAVFLPALAICMLLVCVPAAEAGAGPYHLLGFLPSAGWAFSMIRREAAAGIGDERDRAAYRGATAAVLAALVLGYAPILAIAWQRCLYSFAETPRLRQATAEIDRALSDNPGKTMAVGPGSAAIDLQRLRVVPVFHGNPLPIDSSAWMTFQADGVSDVAVRRAIADCRVEFWLLPTRDPFVMKNGYNGREEFPADVQRVFHANYALYRSGKYFDEWRCSRSRPEGAAADGR